MAQNQPHCSSHWGKMGSFTLRTKRMYADYLPALAVGWDPRTTGDQCSLLNLILLCLHENKLSTHPVPVRAMSFLSTLTLANHVVGWHPGLLLRVAGIVRSLLSSTLWDIYSGGGNNCHLLSREACRECVGYALLPDHLRSTLRVHLLF